MERSERFVDVNGVRLHVVEQGHGPLVILLHGFPEFWYSWRHQLPVLAGAGYHAVAPDMRGYNLSDKPGDYSIEALVADVVSLGRAVAGPEARVHLAGHDWGGVVAWQVAAREPAFVKSLIIMNAPHPTLFARNLRRSPRQVLRSSYMLFFQAPRLAEWALTRRRASAIADAFRRSAARPGAFSDADLDAYRRAFLRPGAASAAIGYYRRAFRQGARSLPKHAILVPALVLWGERDPVLPPSVNDGLDEWVKNLTIRRIPDCGHWTQQERPDVVNREMLEWLARASGLPKGRLQAGLL